MLLDKIFERFAEESPVTVMARGLLERTLDPEPLEELFAATATEQYTDKLLFSTIIETMGLVVCGFYKSIHAVYKDQKHRFNVAVKNLYEKLQRVAIPVMQQLVRHNASHIQEIMTELNCPKATMIPGSTVRILDGNCLAGTHHRLKVLRNLGAAALPGKSVVVYDPLWDVICDVFPCEDGHAQERSLLPEILERVQAKELYIGDRNFCTLHFLGGLVARDAFGLFRQHANLPWEKVTELVPVGTTPTGRVSEQLIRLEVAPGLGQTWRRIVIQLNEPTRDGEWEVVLLTNVDETITAVVLAQAYLGRWQIETVFQVITDILHCEQPSLGYPAAALLSFCVTLLGYNIIAVLQGTLRVVQEPHPKPVKVSWHHLTEKIRRDYGGMMIAIPLSYWEIFRTLSVAELVELLLALARRVPLEKYSAAPTRPKKPPKKRHFDPQHPHVSTARLLANQE